MMVKKNNNKLILSILVIFIYIAWPLLISSIFTSFGINASEQTKNIIEFVGYLVLLTLFVLLYKKMFIDDLNDIKNNSKKYLKLVLKWFLIMSVAIVVVNAVAWALIDTQTDVSSNQQDLINLFKNAPIMLIFLQIIYYPIIEGIVFRKAIRDVVNNKYAFILISGLMFWFFNFAYSDLSLGSLFGTLYCFIYMCILSKIYFETKNFVISTFVLVLYEVVVTIFLITLG